MIDEQCLPEHVDHRDPAEAEFPLSDAREQLQPLGEQRETGGGRPCDQDG